jgi:hypothetical protein
MEESSESVPGMQSALMVGVHETALVITDGLPAPLVGDLQGGNPKVFKVSTGPGECFNCGSLNSPLWRSGWNVQDLGYVNLCNKCG